MKNVSEERATVGTPDELTARELDSIAGGRVYRITNVRVNAQPLAGGSASGGSPIQP